MAIGGVLRMAQPLELLDKLVVRPADCLEAILAVRACLNVEGQRIPLAPPQSADSESAKRVGTWTKLFRHGGFS